MRPLGQASSIECSLSVWGHWGLWAWEWWDLVHGWDRPPCAGPHGKEGVGESQSRGSPRSPCREIDNVGDGSRDFYR